MKEAQTEWEEITFIVAKESKNNSEGKDKMQCDFLLPFFLKKGERK
jgi:hypothetical protein